VTPCYVPDVGDLSEEEYEEIYIGTSSTEDEQYEELAEDELLSSEDTSSSESTEDNYLDESDES
jgi:hypothetical protein